MDNITSTLHIDYVFLDSSERKKFAAESHSYLKSIPANDCYRVYGNFVILFIEEKVGQVKYSSYKNYINKK